MRGGKEKSPRLPSAVCPRGVRPCLNEQLRRKATFAPCPHSSHNAKVCLGVLLVQYKRLKMEYLLASSPNDWHGKPDNETVAHLGSPRCSLLI